MKILFFLVAAFTMTSCSTTIYLVRHGEKAAADGTMMTSDPALSTAGQQRAAALKDSLAAKHLSQIFATEFKRTQQTVQPTAEAKTLTTTIYKAAKSDSLILALTNHKGKNYLVAGHSNTVPAMLRKIGFTVSDIPETDFDNFFTVKIRWFFGRKMQLVKATYGAATN